MIRNPTLLVVVLLVFAGIRDLALGQPLGSEVVAIADVDPAALSAEHVYGGLPMDEGTIYVRQGYVLGYDPDRRVPSWVAYRLTPDFLNTPPREGRFTTFRADPDVAQAPRSDDYTHSGYDRGHLAPYFAMGGDRDGDGCYAADGDEHDVLTVYQGNYMATSPRSTLRASTARRGCGGRSKRGSGTPWSASTNVPPGSSPARSSAPKRYHAIGPEEDIEVPPMFYMLVVLEQDEGELPVALAAALQHSAEVGLEFDTNHLGLLAFDEPRQQSAKVLSFEQLLKRAAKAGEVGHQVIFATSEKKEVLHEDVSRCSAHLQGLQWARHRKRTA